MPTEFASQAAGRVPWLLHFLARAFASSILIAGIAIPWSTLPAQQVCSYPGMLNVTDVAKKVLLQSPGNLEMKLAGGMMLGVDARWFGSARTSVQVYRRPVGVKCDPLSASIALKVQEMFKPSTPNVLGGATGANAASSPFIANPGTSEANATAAEVFVGYVDDGSSTPFHAFRWTEATGLVDLGTLVPANNANLTSMATGVNLDGSVISGFSETSTGGALHAFRWTAAGMVDLGAPAGASYNSRALAVNGAGDVLVGDATFADPNAFTGFRIGAFRWTSAGGFQSLGALEPGYFSIATDVSTDGTVIVGQGGIEVFENGSSIRRGRTRSSTATQPSAARARRSSSLRPHRST